MIINRTDANQQYFNLTFAEDFDLITIQNNKLYHYKSNTSELDYEIDSEEVFLNFSSDSRTTKLFETYKQLVSRDLMPNQNLIGE
jgi:hypothetical protein